MPIEIERKFLVEGNSWKRDVATSWHLRQAYLMSNESLSVRVRIIDSDSATMAVKVPDVGISRFEFEQDIPLTEAQALIRTAENAGVEKTRYDVDHDGHRWTIDCYHGDNDGLVVAELELDEEIEQFSAPPWLGREITGVDRYRNSILARRPYRHWQEQMALPIQA